MAALQLFDDEDPITPESSLEEAPSNFFQLRFVESDLPTTQVASPLTLKVTSHTSSSILQQKLQCLLLVPRC